MLDARRLELFALVLEEDVRPVAKRRAVAASKYRDAARFVSQLFPNATLDPLRIGKRRLMRVAPVPLTSVPEIKVIRDALLLKENRHQFPNRLFFGTRSRMSTTRDGRISSSVSAPRLFPVASNVFAAMNSSSHFS